MSRVVSSQKPIVLPLGQRMTPKSNQLSLNNKKQFSSNSQKASKNAGATKQFRNISNLKKAAEEKSQDIPPAHKQSHKKNFIAMNKSKAKTVPQRAPATKQPVQTPKNTKSQNPEPAQPKEEVQDPRDLKEDIVRKMNNLMSFLQDHCESIW